MTGQDIKRLRQRLLLLETELADELGVSVSTIRFWEENVMGISIKRQRQILEYCKNKGIEI